MARCCDDEEDHDVKTRETFEMEIASNENIGL
jgi:hypothetical protein